MPNFSQTMTHQKITIGIWTRNIRRIAAWSDMLLLLTFMMYSVTVKHFKTPELIQWQTKILKGSKPKLRGALK